jgi:bifunctional DNA-binding transcriptional regulator/antitoxin component of YhaV-PrlF toxin-antitoxin module
MHPNTIIKKISSGYQITIPNEFRKDNDLEIGSMVSIYTEGAKLVIEPFQHRTEALKKLKALFKKTPKEFANLSEKEVSKLVAKEIKSLRQ